MGETTDMRTSNFSGTEFGNKATGFDAPTQLPRDAEQQRQWQAANKTWWESTPMRYDWRDTITAEAGTEDYFREVDARFLASVRKYMPWRRLPFDRLIPFADLIDKDVLEIGTGQGTHAQIIAPLCKSFTGIDLTESASRMCERRLKLFGIAGNIQQMDAECMTFADDSFDYVWSWGVIHHSSNTLKLLEEMHRVLRTGGRSTVMVYHRSWWHFHVGAFLRQVFQARSRGGGLHHAAQGGTDGAIARFYTAKEWRAVTAGLFEVDEIRIYGLKVELLPLPHGRLKVFLEGLIPNGLARLLTNHLGLGSFLVANMRKTQPTATVTGT